MATRRNFLTLMGAAAVVPMAAPTAPASQALGAIPVTNGGTGATHLAHLHAHAQFAVSILDDDLDGYAAKFGALSAHVREHMAHNIMTRAFGDAPELIEGGVYVD